MNASTKVRRGSIPSAPILIGFAILAYGIYSPALEGEFLSDDFHYVQTNGYVHDLSAENLRAILDPTGPLIRIVENYAPVHLLLHSLAWQLFGPEVTGHHILNILLHGLASGLLFLLLRRSGLSDVPALLGAMFFLVHPANVEAVAWISQLKTTSSMVLMLGALLFHPRRPAVALLLFALALLAKPTAAVGLFVVVAFGLVRARGAPKAGPESRGPVDWHWRWIAGWGLALAVFAVFEFLAFAQTAGTHSVQVVGLDARLRTIFASALRYLAMATTSYGLGAFHELDPASWLDPWWLASWVVLAGLAWRTAIAVRGRRLEAAYWVWAAVSFAPISGIIPLPHIIADRYLYFMLPGLIGGALLAVRALVRQLFSRREQAVPVMLGRVGIVVALIWIAAFGQRSYARAMVWQSEASLNADIQANYPEGRWAMVERAAEAAERGDAERAVSLLRRARARGFDKLDVLLGPRYAKIRQAPGFAALLAELAQDWVERVTAIKKPTQADLMVLAQGQIVLGDIAGARESLKRAVYAGGPMTSYLYQALESLDQLEREAR